MVGAKMVARLQRKNRLVKGESAVRSPTTSSKAVSNHQFRLFALQATADLGKSVAQALGCNLAAHEERAFEDGEHKVRPLDAVGGSDVYVVQSLHGGPSETANDKLCRLLFFIGALKDAGAARVTPCAISLLCSKGSPHQAERSRYHPIHCRHVRSRWDRLRCHARGPQSGRI